LSESEVKKTEKSKSKKIIILCIVLILIVGAAITAFNIVGDFQEEEIAENLPVNVRVSSVELMSIYSTAPISGRIEPIDEVIIMPMATGEVTRVNVRMGDRVSVGTSLFEIDRTQAAAGLNQAQAGLSQAQASLGQAQSGLNQANEMLSSHRTSYERMQTLYNEGAISLQSLEQARTQYVTARESVNSARASVNLANASVSSAQASVTSAGNAHGNTNVTSPINGYVTALNVSVGSMASPGVAAAVVVDVSSLEINTSVSEYLAFRLTVGTPVEIRVATLGDRVHTGTIAAISPAPVAGGLTFPVRISVDNDNGYLMAGMFAEIHLIADERDMVVAVPSDTIVMRAGRTIVVVLDNNDIPEFREVTIGIDNGDYAEVLSGLSVGERIVTTGQHFANEGEVVNIIE